jgi:acetylornithine deacetylase/succinyl-diaminopimelate desuccinylase-like protein
MKKNKNLLLDLIKINSESENEKQIGDYICEILHQKGFKIKKQLVNNETGTYNILAYIGKPKVIFSNHIDTVPGQLEIKVIDGKIFGRGACDNKSQVAAAILASERALDAGLTDFGLLFTIQEEKDLLGAKYALSLIPDTCKLIVVGEPTNLDMVIGHNGILVFELISKGKTAHGSVPEKGINAIELLIDDLNILREAKFNVDKVLGKNILNVGKISGGTADNIVPDYAKAVIAYRTVGDSSKIINKIKSLVKSEVNVLLKFEPFFADLIKDLAKIIKTKTKTVRYFTEASIFSQRSNVIILGAGNINEAHSQKEFVSIKEYEKLVVMYLHIVTFFNN